MSDLGKLIGGVMTGLTVARRNADIAARNVALEYQRDPLLAVFPVPRIDFQNVHATIPLVLQDVTQPPPPTPVDPDAQFKEAQALAADLVNQALEAFGLTRGGSGEDRALMALPPDDDGGIVPPWKLPPGDEIPEEPQPGPRPLPLPHIPPEPGPAVIAELQKKWADQLFQFAQKSGQQLFRQQLSAAQQPEILVGATAGDLDKAPPAALGKIHIEVGVMNYQWVEVDRDANGEPIHKLTPFGR
jgi:hypothetical protein